MRNEYLPDTLPGINIKEGLDRLKLSRQTYKKILIGYIKNNKTMCQKLKDAYEEEDWETVRITAHTLKGSGGNIGTPELKEKSLILEKSAKNQKVQIEMINDVCNALNIVFDSIRSIEPIEQSDLNQKINLTPIKIDNKKFAESVIKFANAIDMANPVEIKNSFEEIKKYISSNNIKAIEDKISGYNYDEALEIINTIAKKMGV